MAPSPENDSPPKAPDKEDKRGAPDAKTDDNNKQETDFYNLNEKDLKNLLDEAISYKSPKDREGKSELFNNLLTDAENELRNARATSASGPETVRHYNKRATKRHGKGRKASSISENLTHSGSLNNLTKEDLFEETIRQRPMKTVSTRQSEGGSLPCNVNVGAFHQYPDDFRLTREMNEIKTTISVVKEREVAVDAIRKKTDGDVIESLTNLSLKSKKSQKTTNVDDRIPVSVLDNVPSVDVVEYKKSTDTTITNSFMPSNVSGGLPFNGRGHREEKKVDENCNAVPQQQIDGRKAKTKKKPMEKNVTVWESSKVTGHRSDIIDDVDKLIDYIDGTDMRKDKSGKSNVQKKLQKHIFDDGKTTNKKQRTRAKPKTGGSLQKSNSLDEISTTKIEDFEFLPEENVVLRQTKSNTDRPRERRSWGTSEPVQVQALYTNASAENLETADFRVVTKKKKSKKQRRNSLSSRKTYREEASGEFNRVPSPEPRRKSAISVPHSEKSNDSSDVDSVHSLPVDTANLSREIADDESNFPISYADIAKNSNNNNNNNTIAGGNNNNNNNNGNSEKVKIVTNNNNNNGGGGVVNNKSERNVKKEKAKCAIVEKQGSVEITEVKKETVTVEKPIINLVNYTQNFPSIISKEKVQVNDMKVRNPIAEIQTWPAIPNNNNNKNVKNSIVSNQKKIQNHFKNTKNLTQSKLDKNMMQNTGDTTSTTLIYNNYNIPIHIPDVRSIEKQFKNSAKYYNAEPQEDVVRNSAVQCELQKEENCLSFDVSTHRTLSAPATNINNPNYSSAINLININSCAAPIPNIGGGTSNSRPAVVILSGTAEKEVSGITFGFDIEQLLSTDVCADFMARFVPPPRNDDVSKSFNLDKIVNFIGIAWEDVVKESNGKVQYYTENL